VFGHVIEGMDVVRTLESQETSRLDIPKKPCRIINCGELPIDGWYLCGSASHVSVWVQFSLFRMFPSDHVSEFELSSVAAENGLSFGDTAEIEHWYFCFIGLMLNL